VLADPALPDLLHRRLRAGLLPVPHAPTASGWSNSSRVGYLPPTGSGALFTAHTPCQLYPQPVSLELAALAVPILFSPAASALAFASKRKICNSLFFSSEANLKILPPPTLLVSLFLGSGTAGHLRFGSAGHHRTSGVDPGLSKGCRYPSQAFRFPRRLSPRLCRRALTLRSTL
jgi:hypothetical protein